MTGQSPAGAGVAAQSQPNPGNGNGSIEQPRNNSGSSSAGNGAGGNGNGNDAQAPLAAPIGDRLGAVLGRLELNPEVLKDLGRDLSGNETKPAAAAAGETPAVAAGTELPAVTPAATTSTAGTTQQPNDGQQASGEQEQALPDEWPESARAQVMEERRKRQTRTTERDQANTARQAAEARAQQLEQELQQAARVMQSRPVAVAASERDPLADVQNEQQLAEAIRDYEQLQDFAVAYPDGVQNVLIGRDSTGQEIRKDYTREEIAKMKLDADRILTKAVPAKGAYIQQQRQSEEVARTAHPNLFNPQAAEHQEARQVLQVLPEITRIPAWQLWIGDAQRGRNARIAEEQQQRSEVGGQQSAGNGAAGAAQQQQSPAVQAILRGQRQPPIAPSVPVVRGSGISGAEAGDRGADVKQAREQLEASGGSDDALNDYIATLRGKGASARGGRQAALV